jgi:hypothetical protein
MNDTKRIYLVNAPEDRKLQIAKFLDSIGSKYELADSEKDIHITIDFPKEREISTSGILHAGGKISCPDAFNVAKKLGMARGNIGEFLNLLDIKIFGCQLGCFK